jgi:hypothetical protein
MKKSIALIILLINFFGNAQCPVPSNLNLSIPYPTAAQFSWSENGNATAWEVIVVPDFYVGAPMPLMGVITSNNPFLFTSLPPTYGCYVFFVRSRCSVTDASSWVAIGSLGCNTNVYSYLATLSNDSFTINNDSNIKIFPNPSSNFFKIVTNAKIDKITVFDTLGKEIFLQAQNNNEVNIEKLSKGIYLIEIISENEKIYRKFIKE